jgi:hypothetical protein
MTVERDPRGCFTAGRLARVVQGQRRCWSGMYAAGAAGRLPFAGLGRVRAAAFDRAGEGQIGQGSLRPYSSCMRWLLADRRGCRTLIRQARSPAIAAATSRRSATACSAHRGIFVRGHDGRRTTPVAGRHPHTVQRAQRGEAAGVRAGRGDGRQLRDQRRVQWSVFLALRAARWNTHSCRPANRVVVRTAPWIRMALVFLAVGLPGPPERNSALSRWLHSAARRCWPFVFKPSARLDVVLSSPPLHLSL